MSRPFSPVEWLMFLAAARDVWTAWHLYLLAARLVGPLRFLSPSAVVGALVISARRR
ncbi:hypothetical protein [Streptomyces sp. NPDC014685]|uniref:hypothetical protein n=1 Tax=Streptomyces sp. NPDC014685 TaxID=3364881 RepID=UPI0036F88639